MPSCVYTSSSPARRRARLMSTGRETGVMPYSLSATTVAPSLRKWSINGRRASSSRRAAWMVSGESGPERWGS